ncbi:MAG TPA: thiamine phosphate synthase [Archangium sp.]|nr:thiamine phosphate synthase [Archangium sp.]
MNAHVRPSLPRGLHVLCDDTVRPELPPREKAAGLLAGGARVVQLRMKRTPLREALLGPEGLVGATVRGLEEAHAARAAGADYVGLGPVFGTATKQVNAQVLGLGGLGADLADKWVHGGAAASDVLLAEDIAERVRRLAAAFDRGAQGASLVGGDV